MTPTDRRTDWQAIDRRARLAATVRAVVADWRWLGALATTLAALAVLIAVFGVARGLEDQGHQQLCIAAVHGDFFEAIADVVLTGGSSPGADPGARLEALADLRDARHALREVADLCPSIP
jgi:hypothetical protein